MPAARCAPAATYLPGAGAGLVGAGAPGAGAAWSVLGAGKTPGHMSTPDFDMASIASTHDWVKTLSWVAFCSAGMLGRVAQPFFIVLKAVSVCTRAVCGNFSCLRHASIRVA